jgi:hypothetical protein
MSAIRQPEARIRAGVRQERGARAAMTADCSLSAPVLLAVCIARAPSLGPTPQAGTAAARTTGFSTIGRLITAESKPNRTESHHTAS